MEQFSNALKLKDFKNYFLFFRRILAK